MTSAISDAALSGDSLSSSVRHNSSASSLQRSVQHRAEHTRRREREGLRGDVNSFVRLLPAAQRAAQRRA